MRNGKNIRSTTIREPVVSPTADPLINTANFFGGWGGALSFGLTGRLSQWINRSLGYDEFEYGGAYFQAGSAVGAAHGFAISAAGGVKAVSSVKAFLAARSASGAKAVTETVSVYRALGQGDSVIYVGITNNLARRALQQSSRFEIEAIKGLPNLTRHQARAVEQVLIEYHGLARNGGSLLNKINSIARSNPTYADALLEGKALLERAGYFK